VKLRKSAWKVFKIYFLHMIMIDFTSEYGFWHNIDLPARPNAYFDVCDTSLDKDIAIGPPVKDGMAEIDEKHINDRMGIYLRGHESLIDLHEAIEQYERAFSQLDFAKLLAKLSRPTDKSARAT
jgi:hypothetical protein